jgi:hypothetical protein
MQAWATRFETAKGEVAWLAREAIRSWDWQPRLNRWPVGGGSLRTGWSRQRTS